MTNELIPIQSYIHEFRGQKVMLDFDLAKLYQVETKALNQAVKRNIERFPADFMLRLAAEDVLNMRSQIVTASKRSTSAAPFQLRLVDVKGKQMLYLGPFFGR